MKIYATNTHILKKLLTSLSIAIYFFIVMPRGIDTLKEAAGLMMITLTLIMAVLALLRIWIPLLLIESGHVFSLGLLRKLEIKSVKEASVFRKKYFDLEGPKGKVRLEQKAFKEADLKMLKTMIGNKKNSGLENYRVG